MNDSDRVSIDKEIAAFIERFEDEMGQEGQDVSTLRQTYRTLLTEQGKSLSPVETRQIHVPTRHGPVLTRLYSESQSIKPLVIYMHGGGFVVGDLDSVDLALHRLCREADVNILSIDYALAPEHKYPVAFEQCQDILEWSSSNLSLLGSQYKIGVAGDSAGGNLAALLAIWARDTAKIDLQWQCLINPVLDFKNVLNPRTKSRIAYTAGPILNAEVMKFFIESYFSSHDDLIAASPSLIDNFSGLPKAFIAVAECDPLRDEALEYGENLQAAGVPVTTKKYKGMTHNFIILTNLSKIARQFIDELIESAREALH